MASDRAAQHILLMHGGQPDSVSSVLCPKFVRNVAHASYARLQPLAASELLPKPELSFVVDRLFAGVCSIAACICPVTESKLVHAVSSNVRV